MAVITPGVDFLARNLFFLSLPAALILGFQHLCSQFGFFVPTWALVVVFIFTVPIYVTTRIIVREISEQRQATAMGARVVPRAQARWIGSLDLMKDLLHHWHFGYPGDGLWDLFQHGETASNIRILWENVVITISPEHIKLILATDFNNYVKGERFREGMGSVLGTGVFNSDGEMWKFHRSMTRPFFTRERITHFDLFDRHAESVIAQMKLRIRAGYAIDFHDAMARFTLDSATEFLFGSSVDSLSAGLPYPHHVTSVPPGFFSARAAAANAFSGAFLESQAIIATRQRLGWVWPLFEIFKDKTKEPMKVVNDYLDPIVKDAAQKRKLTAIYEFDANKEDAEIGDDDTLLDHLVKYTSDPTVLKDEMLNIMIAGRDSTAGILTIVIYFLSTHPAVTARLREEILLKIGPTHRPSYDDIRDMKYLRAVINETLRLFPAVETVKATTWPSANPTDKPFYIPAGTKTSYSVFMMHRRTDLWGPDAEEFDPDRFLDDRFKKYLLPNSFIFMPFNAGPRICLGQQFAYNEMSFMLIRLLQNFSTFTLDPDSQPPESRPPAEWAKATGRKAIEQFCPKVALTLYPLGGLWGKIQEAEVLN